MEKIKELMENNGALNIHIDNNWKHTLYIIKFRVRGMFNLPKEFEQNIYSMAIKDKYIKIWLYVDWETKEIERGEY